MTRLTGWIPVLAIALLAVAAPDAANAQVKTGTPAEVITSVVQKIVKKRARTIDGSITSCKMFGSDGVTPRPAQTYMKQSDQARVRAEYELMRRAASGNGDEAAYYMLLTGDSRANPKFNRFRVGDSLGMKKGCTLSGTP